MHSPKLRCVYLNPTVGIGMAEVWWTDDEGDHFDVATMFRHENGSWGLRLTERVAPTQWLMMLVEATSEAERLLANPPAPAVILAAKVEELGRRLAGKDRALTRIQQERDDALEELARLRGAA